MARTTDEPGTAKKRGRPVDSALLEQILLATLRGLGEHGYNQLEIERVAAMAKCSKSTIYRHWATKPQLVAAAITFATPSPSEVDTGDFLGDILEYLAVGPSDLTYTLIPPRAWEAMLNPETAVLLRDAILEPREEIAARFIQRAKDRGDIAEDVDGLAILHLAQGANFYRQYLGQPSLPVPAMHDILAAIVASPPRLTQPEPAERN